VSSGCSVTVGMLPEARNKSERDFEAMRYVADSRTCCSESNVTEQNGTEIYSPRLTINYRRCRIDNLSVRYGSVDRGKYRGND
jgi:hypothetical protein